MDGNIDKKKINEDMQRGYTFLMDDDTLSACDEWKKVWSAVVDAIKGGAYQSIEDFDKEFDGDQCIYNWASDYEMELGNALRDDMSYAETRIDFCAEYLKYVSDTDENNSLNMKKAIAETYFQTGMADKGEDEYKKTTQENPTWAWGWIGWSYEYSSNTEYKNLERSIEILEQALNVDGIEEKDEINSCLRTLYASTGKTVIADVMEEKPENVKGLPEGRKTIQSANQSNPERKVKIGRNEQCPCGSGQKYKRCCGRNN